MHFDIRRVKQNLIYAASILDVHRGSSTSGRVYNGMMKTPHGHYLDVPQVKRTGLRNAEACVHSVSDALKEAEGHVKH